MKKKWEKHAFPRGKYVQILRMMRMCMLIIVLGAANAFGIVKSQNLSLNVKDVALKEIFQFIEKNSEYRFLYKSDEILGVRVDELKVKNSDVDAILQKCLSGTSLVYEKDGILIMVKRKVLPVSPALQSVAAINGRVTDKSGEPVAGATVRIKGSNIGVATDQGGDFKMNVPDMKGMVLVFSFIGMKSQEIPYTGQKELRVVMEEDVSEMDEVVVTGYQNISRRELASAVKQIKAADVMQNGKFSIDQMLAGQVAGMVVMQTSGEPGATPKIRIRGLSSINGSKAPLWVLDGIILDDPVQIDYSQLGGDDAAYLIGNAIAGVNPQDIETITVLKDASATAIYGVQAANGVIVVTTKKGKAGKPRVTYNGTLSLSQRESYGALNLMNAAERVQLSQDIIDASLKYSRFPANLGYEGLYLQYMNKDIDYDQFRSGVDRMVERNTDWFDVLFRDVLSHNHTVSMSGGDDKTTYYGSLGYADNQGTALGSSSRRYTATLKLNSWLHQKVYVGLQVNGSINKNEGFHSSTNPNNWAYTTSRTIPAYNEDGSDCFYETTSDEWGRKETMKLNYRHELANTGKEGKVTAITTKLDLRWDIWNGIRYEASGSILHQQSTNKEWANDRSYYVSRLRGYNYGSAAPGSDWEKTSVLPFGGELVNGSNEQTSYTLRNQLNYSNIFKDDHVFAISAISEIRSIAANGISGKYYGWMPDRGQMINPILTDKYIVEMGNRNPTITDNIKNYVSWIGSTTYSYKDKWVANANVRMDGSNQFGDNPKYRFLPIWSVAGKYTITRENFLKDNPVLSDLAFRGSYGIQGNVDKATSPDLVLKIGAINEFTSLPESTISMLPNPDLRWEKTTSYNIGLDFSLWKGRIGGTFDYYKKKGTDMIMTKQVSQVTGQQFVKINAGDVNNTGVELDVIGYPVRTNDFEFGIGIVYSYNKNELIKANDDKEITTQDMINGDALIVGEALGTIYSYRLAHLDHATGLPVFYNKAGSATSVINGETAPNYRLYSDDIDVVKSGIGNDNPPPFSGSFKVHFRYKNLRLTGDFLYSFGGVGRLPDIYGSEYENVFDPSRNVTKEFIERWKTPGDEGRTLIPALYDSDTYAKLPKPEYMDNRDIFTGISIYDKSDVRVAKTDNLRLGSLNLSYMLPWNATKTIGAQNIMVSLQATNLFLITDKRWHGRDPETLGSNSSLPRTYTLNLQVSF